MKAIVKLKNDEEFVIPDIKNIYTYDDHIEFEYALREEKAIGVIHKVGMPYAGIKSVVLTEF